MRKIDNKILPIIKELNNNGLETTWSCIGHKKYNDNEGYITFKNRLNSKQIMEAKRILHKNNIPRVINITSRLMSSDAKAKDGKKLITKFTFSPKG